MKIIVAILAVSLFFVGCEDKPKKNKSGNKEFVSPGNSGDQTVTPEQAAAANAYKPNLGFRDADSTELNDDVRNASGSVVEIVVPNNFVKLSKISKEKMETKEAAKEIIESYVDDKKKSTEVDRLSEYRKDVMNAYVDACEEAKLTDCSIPRDIVTGTGVVVDDGSTLITNLVVVDLAVDNLSLDEEFKKLKATERAKKLEDQKLQIFIMNKDSEMIFNGLANEVKIQQIEESILPSLVQVKAKINGAPVHNYVELKANQKIAEPMLVMSEKLAEKTQVFNIGYADKTTNRSEGNATGEGLTVSTGEVLNLDIGLLVQESSLARSNEETQKLYRENIFMTSADISGGMQGGAVVNVKGELVGILVHDYSQNIQKKMSMARLIKPLVSEQK